MITKLLLAVALCCAWTAGAMAAAPASVPYNAWVLIASTGASVEVQNLSSCAVRLSVSVTTPSTLFDGQVIDPSRPYRKYDAPLPNNLYASALCPSGASVAVNPIGAGGSGTAASPNPVSQPDQTGTGSLATTLNATYGVALARGQGVVAFRVSGLTGSGAALVPEASNDGGTTWSTVNAVAPSTGALSTVLTTDQQFRVNAGGHTNVRLRVSIAGTGTIAVASNATAAQTLEALSNPAQVTPATGTLSDTSPTQQSLSGLTNLEVRAADATTLGQWFLQNQSATTLVVVLCNDAGVTAPCSSRAATLLAGPGGATAQGGSLGWQDTGAWKGRIDVYANAASAQHALMRQ